MITMSDLDVLVKEKLVAFREMIIEDFSKKHPQMFSIINAVMSGKQNKVGLQVMENGRVAGKYTLHVKGVHIANVEVGALEPEVNHPFIGTLKPLFSVERSALESILNDQKSFTDDLFGAIKKYLPDFTINFMR